MKDFTSSRIYHALCGIFDLVVLNLCFLLYCLPLVTIGAAVSAMYAAVYAMQKEEGYSIRCFFRSFRSCLPRGIPAWLLWILAVGVACADFFIIAVYWDFSGAYFLLGLLALVLLLLILVGSCLFPILPRCPSLKSAAARAFVLSIRYLPRMIPVCILNLLPVWMFWFWSYGFLLLSGFYLLIWFSLCAYINVIFLRPILERSEKE